MMRIALLILVFGLMAFPVWCEPTAPAAGEPLNVMVSIYPQKYFVEKIGGNLVNVSVMVEPGVDPHVYDPRPQQMVSLARSKAYFAVGVPFEDVWLPRFVSTNPSMAIVHSEAGIEKIRMEGHDHDHDHKADGRGKKHEAVGKDSRRHGGEDPHLWLSPRLVMIQARNILDGLIKIDPGNKTVYEDNYRKFIIELVDLDRRLLDLFSEKGEKKEFVVFHPAWGYFAQAYGLKQIPIEIEGKEPKAADLKSFIEYARKEGIKVIFVQPQYSTTSASVIANAIGGRVIVADPMAADWAENLKQVAEKFSAALN